MCTKIIYGLHRDEAVYQQLYSVLNSDLDLVFWEFLLRYCLEMQVREEIRCRNIFMIRYTSSFISHLHKPTLLLLSTGSGRQWRCPWNPSHWLLLRTPQSCSEKLFHSSGLFPDAFGRLAPLEAMHLFDHLAYSLLNLLHCFPSITNHCFHFTLIIFLYNVGYYHLLLLSPCIIALLLVILYYRPLPCNLLLSLSYLSHFPFLQPLNLTKKLDPHQNWLSCNSVFPSLYFKWLSYLWLLHLFRG